MKKQKTHTYTHTCIHTYRQVSHFAVSAVGADLRELIEEAEMKSESSGVQEHNLNSNAIQEESESLDLTPGMYVCVYLCMYYVVPKSLCSKTEELKDKTAFIKLYTCIHTYIHTYIHIG